MDLSTMQEFAEKPNGGFIVLSSRCIHCRFLRKYIKGGGDRELVKYSTSRNQMYVLTRAQLEEITARREAREAENAEAEFAEAEDEEDEDDGAGEIQEEASKSTQAEGGFIPKKSKKKRQRDNKKAGKQKT